MDREDIKENIMVTDTWIRGIFMLLFGLCYSVAEVLLLAISVFQFLSALITGSTQPRLLSFGKSLSDYVYQIYLFLTFNSEERPFPFSPWPGEEPPAAAPPTKAVKKKAATKKKAVKKSAPAETEEEPAADDDDDDEAHLGV